MFYPEAKRHHQQEDEVGTSSGKSIRRVVSREENICASDSVTGARRSVVERSIVRTNHQEEDTSNVETTEPLIGLNIPLSKNMLLGGSHRVTMQHSLNPIESPSGEKTINSGAHYYVEEPESPRSIQRVDGLGPGSGDKPNDPYVAPLLSCPVREVGLKNLGEEILASVFQKALNLKRKNSYSPEKVDEGKKQKRLLLEDYESSNRSMEEDVAGIEETLRIRSSVARGGACRARGRRGGRSRGRLAGGGGGGRGVQLAQLSDSELVEVNVGEEAGLHDNDGGNEIGDAKIKLHGNDGSQIELNCGSGGKIICMGLWVSLSFSICGLWVINYFVDLCYRFMVFNFGAKNMIFSLCIY
ncbi:hypothetical protein RHGRI_002886 [Rhododendron griersonianum]|uniref:Uncharacterized protein n=1 Tax=Rhododendron griersonianum TaxID=479676 RepID=A0AAV6LRA3_9ERIC|nr:hypothetical protein RHGRI_002886 [Rhododendron griersonianum]